LAQYDKIARSYDRLVEERPDRVHVLFPSARRYLGELAGKRALDLACGSGLFTRLMRRWGAASVLGVDVSEEMLKIAREREAGQPLGVDYLRADVASMGKLGTFDVVFASFLLHYAPTVEALRAMCANVAANLAPGGRFVAFNENPAHPLHDGERYGVRIAAVDPIADGSRIRLTVQGLDVNHFHYEPATYRAALEAAGFSKIEWRPFLKGERADEGFAPGHWDRFTRGDFSVAVLLAAKG
jgi:SAM-dependent methyltransferase